MKFEFQVAIGLLALAVIGQGFDIAIARTVWPGHYHANTIAVQAETHGDAHSGDPPHHSHSDVAHHHHDADEPGVVMEEADADDPAGVAGGAAKRIALDLDTIASYLVAAAQTGPAPQTGSLPCAFASRTVLPLERPPRPPAG